MAQSAALSRFRVEGLRGQKTIDVSIDENTLVLVGENGSGKTTFLRLMFHFLAGRWGSLSQIPFGRITATINGKEYSVSGEEISALNIRNNAMLEHIPPSARRRLIEAEASGRWEDVHRMYERFLGEGVSRNPKLLRRLSDLHSTLSAQIGAQILYLPTYRRIERELGSILQGIDSDEVKRARVIDQSSNSDAYIELVEFGMGDVEKAINIALESIRDFANTSLNGLTLSYLGDVVSQAYRATAMKEIRQVSDETISSALQRISSTILRDEHKNHLKEIVISARSSDAIPSEHHKIILHYFAKLLQFQSKLQQKEQDIRSFCDLASYYIVDKRFVYDEQRFSFRIEWSYNGVKTKRNAPSIPESENKQGDVKLSDLSSGEKQIVSLFSHLYLSGKGRYFVLIDEPELSLSVPWQRRFLEDIRSGSFCAGLVAVTHSPFIYDNSLRKHTHALGEFVSGADWGNIR